MKRSRQSLIKLFCVGGTIGAVLTYAGLIEPFWIEVHHVSVQDAQLNRVLKGMTALHLTDLHIGALGKRERRVLELVAEIKPDLIFLTGDYVNWNGDYEPPLEFLSRLQAKAGIWAVMGDYDYSNDRKSCLFCHQPASGRRSKRHRVHFLRGSDVTVINDFETDQDLDRIHWECHRLFSLSGDHATQGGRCLKMELFPGLYPGVALKLQHGDWRRYCALAFDVYNDQDVTLTLTVRIDDREDYPDYKDRYNQRFALNPGINYIRIPMDTLQTSGDGRKLDVSHIQRFLLFLHRTERRYELYLDWVRLESERPGAGL